MTPRPVACGPAPVTRLPGPVPGTCFAGRSPLGPRPWLHRLRDGSLRFVRRLRCYYDGVDFSGSCIIGFNSSSSRCGPGGVRPQAKPETSRFPRKELPHMPGSSTTPGRTGPRNNASVHVAFRVYDHVGTRNYLLSRLNGWPMHSPVNASSASSRIPTHDSGPMRFATPSSQRTFTAYSLPVSTGAPKIKKFRTTRNLSETT